MIRPITLLCFAAACGSGLYLYQEKHRVQLLDDQIKLTVHQTEQMRAQTRMLHAEWTLLNDPERLRKLGAQFLPQLQPVSPAQYTDMADLDSRLPAVPPPPPPAPPGPPAAAPENSVPVAQAAPAASPPESAAEPVRTAAAQSSDRPAQPTKPAQPAAPPQQVAVVPPRQRPPVPHPAPAHPVVAQVRHPETRSDAHLRSAAYDPYAAERDRRQREARVQVRREQFRHQPQPAYRGPVVAQQAPQRFPSPAPAPRPYTGSLLGMAQGRPAAPPPRPMPVNSYVTFGERGN